MCRQLEQGLSTPLRPSEGTFEVAINGGEVKVSPEQHKLRNTVQRMIKLAESTFIHDDRLDMSSSGTTLCAVLISDNSLTCFNVGDSRAVVGGRSAKGLRVIPLCWDQKPTDLREKTRVANEGGNISSLKVKNGNVAGPERLWIPLPSGAMQGIAMTRSIGDHPNLDLDSSG